ncbi:MAG: molybdenum cofactor guanylyltransferase MobA [Burkholderiales bacterium PBB3]|nr:MAG: molybdenum cofactor guanylyltransferase MobA [Burkholderiales bacterium PBB3]
MQNPDIDLSNTTALVLAGGRGSRMGGVDKGLEHFRGQPLVETALQRLALQTGGPLHGVLINANRNAEVYTALGQSILDGGPVAVVADTLEDYAGPLAGFLVGLMQCETAYLLTVPCDSPLFPLDLGQRLMQALLADGADIAMVSAPEAGRDGTIALRSQPVFCLMKTTLLPSLSQFLAEGGRKIDAWTALHRVVPVAFNAPGDDPQAFANANTLDELRALEKAEKVQRSGTQ